MINTHKDLLNLYLVHAEDFSAAQVCKLWRNRLNEIQETIISNIFSKIANLIGARSFALLKRRVSRNCPSQKTSLQRIFASLYQESKLLNIPWNNPKLLYDHYKDILTQIVIKNDFNSIGSFPFGNQFFEDEVSQDQTEEQITKKFYEWIRTNPPLRGLREIHLNNCNLTRIPSYVFLLSKLETLNFAENQIDHIPPEIAQLKNLKIVSFAGNRVTQVPLELQELKKIKTFDMLSPDQFRRLEFDDSYLQELSGIDIEEGFTLTEHPPEIQELVNGEITLRGLAARKEAQGQKIVVYAFVILTTGVLVFTLILITLV
jgi:Leucine-rich repeat (LRR) protein